MTKSKVQAHPVWAVFVIKRDKFIVQQTNKQQKRQNDATQRQWLSQKVELESEIKKY